MVIASTGHRDRSEATLAAGGLLLGLVLDARLAEAQLRLLEAAAQPLVLAVPRLSG
jgi:hypothetical protein